MANHLIILALRTLWTVWKSRSGAHVFNKKLGILPLPPPHFKDIKNDKNEMNEWKKSIHTVFHCGSQQGSSTGSGAGKPPRHPRLASCLLAGLCGLVFSVPEAKSPHIRELGTPSSDFLTLSCHQQLSWHFRPQGRGGEQRTLPETLLGTPWQADGEVPGIPWNS